MRGGFVACLGGSRPITARLEAAVGALRWHTGSASFHSLGGLQVACLVDDVHGPVVEISAGRLVLSHGAPPEPLEILEWRDRFVGVQSDGLHLEAIRDRMGEAALFYRRVDDEIWFATEIHPLLAIAPTEPDLKWLTTYCATVPYPEATGWLGVKRVLPGQILRVDDHLRMSSRRYFMPRLGSRHGGPSPADAARHFGQLFAIAVEKRLSPRCGVLLSGGLDSSAVAVVAARTARPTLVTVSHPGLPRVDETSHAEATAAVIGASLKTLEVVADPWDPADDHRTFGMPPFALPTGIYGRGLGALAEEGCDVALDGHDGDGVLGQMYAWAANTLLDGRPDRLARSARESGWVFTFKDLVDDLVPPSVLERLRRRPSSPGFPASFIPYFRGDAARRLEESARWQTPRAGWERIQRQALLPPTTQSFEEIELLGARHGIHVEHPFADRDLVDFLITLPHAVKASTASLKPVLRAALVDSLPETVAERADKIVFTDVIDARVDFEACYHWVRDSGVRLPDVDYELVFRDAARPVNDRVFWTRLASAHVFLAGIQT